MRFFLSAPGRNELLRGAGRTAADIASVTIRTHEAGLRIFDEQGQMVAFA